MSLILEAWTLSIMEEEARVPHQHARSNLVGGDGPAPARVLASAL